MLPIFRIYKNILVDYSLLITAACIIMFGNLNLYYIALAAIVHELAHYLAACVTGFQPDHFIIRGLGIELNNVKNKFSPGILIFVAVCGPVANILLACIGYLLHNELFFLVNISIAAVNFLPAFPLDGGQILYGILVRNINRKTAKKAIRVCGKVLGCIIIFFGLLVLYTTKFNFSLLYIGAFIFFTSNSDFYNPILEIVNVKEKNMYKCRAFMVNDDADALEVANTLPYHSVGMVKDKEGKVYDSVTPGYLYHRLLNGQETGKLSELLKK